MTTVSTVIGLLLPVPNSKLRHLCVVELCMCHLRLLYSRATRIPGNLIANSRTLWNKKHAGMNFLPWLHATLGSAMHDWQWAWPQHGTGSANVVHLHRGQTPF